MNDQDVDRRLNAADPASPEPAGLSLMIDRLIAEPVGKSRQWRNRRWRPALIAGGVLAAAGGLVAAVNIDTILLSIPPFSTLGAGESRVVDGLAYSPLEGPDRGEQCELFIDLAGLTDTQFTGASRYWPSIEPAAFASAVEERLGDYPERAAESPDNIEEQAVIDEILTRLDTIVPGIEWGTASPGDPFVDGEPHLTSVSQVCADDLGHSE